MGQALAEKETKFLPSVIAICGDCSRWKREISYLPVKTSSAGILPNGTYREPG